MDTDIIAYITVASIMAIIFMVALMALVRQWRRLHRGKSACPANVPCTAGQAKHDNSDEASDSEDDSVEEVIVSEEVVHRPHDVVGYVRCPRGEPCTGDLWEDWCPCGPGCQCGRECPCRAGGPCTCNRGAEKAKCGCHGQAARVAVENVGTRGVALHSPTGVEEVTSIQDLKRLVNQKRAVVLMYETGCGHCTAMKPAYEAAAHKAACPFLAIDAQNVPEIVEMYHLSGFPTVLKFETGKMVAEYRGDRSEPDLVLFSQ